MMANPFAYDTLFDFISWNVSRKTTRVGLVWPSGAESMPCCGGFVWGGEGRVVSCV
jgi:hypothetical protein